ncbi:MAG: hypothetical protein IH847_11430 [Acidobacteria bacterium]|nr:hypothetical protein [Acidobacteriota bacterium]
MKRRSFLALLILFLAVSPAWAQIALVGSATTATTTSDPTLTISSHTVDSGTAVLVVGCFWRAGDASLDFTGITWNGGAEALTEVRSDPATEASSSGTIIFVLASPTATTADVVISWSGTTGRTTCGATNYSGVDTSAVCEADNGASGTGTSSSVSVTTLTDNAWLVDASGHRAAESRNQAGSEVERWELQATAGGSAATGSSQDLDAGTAGAGKSMGWSWSTSAAYGQSLCALKPAAAAARRLMVISANHPSEHPVAVQPSCPYGYERLHRERAGGRKWANTSKTVKMVISDSLVAEH